MTPGPFMKVQLRHLLIARQAELPTTEYAVTEIVQHTTEHDAVQFKDDWSNAMILLTEQVLSDIIAMYCSDEIIAAAQEFLEHVRSSMTGMTDYSSSSVRFIIDPKECSNAPESKVLHHLGTSLEKTRDCRMYLTFAGALASKFSPLVQLLRHTYSKLMPPTSTPMNKLARAVGNGGNATHGGSE